MSELTKIYKIQPSAGRRMYFDSKEALDAFKTSVAQAEVEELTYDEYKKETK